MRKVKLTVCFAAFLCCSSYLHSQLNFNPTASLDYIDRKARISQSENKFQYSPGIFTNVKAWNNSTAAKSRLTPKWFLRLYSGYGFASPGSYRLTSTTSAVYSIDNVDRDSTTNTQSRKGIGRGWKYGGGLGYSLNDFISIGIDFEMHRTRLENHIVFIGKPYNYDSTHEELHYKASTFTPFIIFKALAKPNYIIYNKLGAVISLPTSFHTSGISNRSFSQKWLPGADDSSIALLGSIVETSEGKYKISAGVGFNVAVGINIRVTNHVRAFLEFFGNFSALHPTSSQKNSITTEDYDSFTPVYDESVYPPIFLRYEPNETHYTTYSTETKKYIESGKTRLNYRNERITPNGTYQTTDYTEERFTANLNAIGANWGIYIRF